MKITQQQFDSFPVIDGRKQCPTGDYSLISSFGKRCSFGEECSFGGGCSFGEGCSFGMGCSFGEECSFGEWCSFGGCSFGEGCSFGGGCSFGERCSFEGNYKYVGNYPYWKFGGFGSRTGSELYVYKFESGLHVRAGCWFGTIEDFRQRVIETYSDEHEYLDIIELCKKVGEQSPAKSRGKYKKGGCMSKSTTDEYSRTRARGG